MNPAVAFEFFGLGAAVGAIGTLIGAGGGFILMPFLLMLYPEQSTASLTAVSLIVVFFNAYAGTWAYARSKRVDFGPGFRFAVAGMPCAILGTWIVQFVPRRPFEVIFGMTLFWIGTLLTAKPLGRNPAYFGDVLNEQRNLSGAQLLTGSVGSAYIGLLSSLLGIGGGILHVPFLIRFLKYAPHRATATSHFVLALVSFAGASAHLVRGDLESLIPQTAMIALGVMTGAPLGAAISPHVRGSLIVRMLGFALCGVGFRLLF